jgi:hypothetical protein
MKKGHFLYITCILVILSCKRDEVVMNSGSSDRVEYEIISLEGDTIHKGFQHYKVKKYKDKSEFLYCFIDTTDKAPNDSACFLYTLFNDSDSIILYGKITCILTGIKYYTVDSLRYKICKYYYDDLHMKDEESEFLLNDKYGLIQIYSLAWNNFVTIDLDSTTKKLNKLLINDTSLFVLRSDNKREYYKALHKKIYNQ